MKHFDKYLPIGSVVLLKQGEKRLMIYGRKQKDRETGTIWDYVACLYPEGNISMEQTYLFNHEQIDRVYFIGYQDEDEIEFTEKYLKDDE